MMTRPTYLLPIALLLAMHGTSQTSAAQEEVKVCLAEITQGLRIKLCFVEEDIVKSTKSIDDLQAFKKFNTVGDSLEIYDGPGNWYLYRNGYFFKDGIPLGDPTKNITCNSYTIAQLYGYFSQDFQKDNPLKLTKDEFSSFKAAFFTKDQKNMIFMKDGKLQEVVPRALCLELDEILTAEEIKAQREQEHHESPKPKGQGILSRRFVVIGLILAIVGMACYRYYTKSSKQKDKRRRR